MEECKCGNRPYREDRNSIDISLTTLHSQVEKTNIREELMWKAIDARIPYRNFFWIFGSAFTIVFTLMLLMYNQGDRTYGALMKMSERLVVVEVNQQHIANAIGIADVIVKGNGK